jgi:hypothetical protein
MEISKVVTAEQTMHDLPVALQVFIVFYAIAWGALSNALPRWRAFDTSRFWADDYARRRIVLSIIVLNLLPPCYFAFWLVVVGSNPGWEIYRWGLRAFLAISVAALAAWTAPFGFHRLWVWIVLRRPQYFYPTNLVEKDWKKDFPGLPQDDLSPKWVRSNFLFAIAFLVVSFCLPYVFFSVVSICSLKSR